MSPTRNFFFVLLLGLAFAGMLAPLRTSSQPAEQWPVVFWAALPDADNEAMVALIKSYNDANPYRPVHFTNFSSTQALVDALNGNPSPQPNLALIDSRWLGAIQPKLIPANRMMNAAGSMVSTMEQADSFPAAWKACLLNDEPYALPFSAETAALVLNREFFKKFPPVPTIQAWQKLGAQAMHQGKGWGIVLPLSWSPVDLGLLWLDFSSTFSKNPPPGDREKTSALSVWKKWANKMKLSPASPSTVPSDFGKGATWILFPRDVANLTGDFAVKPLPRFKAPWGFLRVQSIVFFTKDNSWDFANFLTSYDTLKWWSMNTQTVPVNKQVYLSPDYLSQTDTHRRWMRIFIGGIVHAIPPYNAPDAPKTLADFGDTVVKSLSGNAGR